MAAGYYGRAGEGIISGRRAGVFHDKMSGFQVMGMRTLAPPTGHPARVTDLMRNLGATAIVAAPNPELSGVSSTTAHWASRPFAVTLHSIVALPPSRAASAAGG